MTPHRPALTAQQLEAATMVFEGHSVREVARRIGVDEDPQEGRLRSRRAMSGDPEDDA